MANIQDKMNKKRERQSIVADMARFNEQEEVKTLSEEETTTAPPENVESEKESEDIKVEQVAKTDEADQKQTVKETKEDKSKKKDKKPYEGVLTYKQVPDENKTVRKNIVLYPSLCKEIERIVNIEKKKGNKKFTFNDLVNQVLIDYANEYSWRKDFIKIVEEFRNADR